MWTTKLLDIFGSRQWTRFLLERVWLAMMGVCTLRWDGGAQCVSRAIVCIEYGMHTTP